MYCIALLSMIYAVLLLDVIVLHCFHGTSMFTDPCSTALGPHVYPCLAPGPLHIPVQLRWLQKDMRAATETFNSRA